MGDLTDIKKSILQSVGKHHLITGPPGSGKTALLTGLYREFVRTGKQVLVFSFSSDGAHCFQEQLRQAGISGQALVRVFTPLSFAIRVLEQLRPGLEVNISDRRVGFALQAIADQLYQQKTIRHPPYTTTIDHWIDLIYSCKNIGLLPEGLTVRPSDPVLLQDFVSVYRAYQEFLAQHQWLDYGETIRQATAALRTCRPDDGEQVPAAEVLLIDELQEFSAVQLELVQALRHCSVQTTQHPLAVIAAIDPTETLFRFRGAQGAGPVELARLLDTPLETITLAAPPAGTAWRARFLTETDELEWLAHRIQELALDGVAYRDMAIITRAQDDLIERVRRALDIHTIPHSLSMAWGLFDSPVVALVQSLLTILARPRQDVSDGCMKNLLNSFLVQLTPAERSALSRLLHRQRPAEPDRTAEYLAPLRKSAWLFASVRTFRVTDPTTNAVLENVYTEAERLVGLKDIEPDAYVRGLVAVFGLVPKTLAAYKDNVPLAKAYLEDLSAYLDLIDEYSRVRRCFAGPVIGPVLPQLADLLDTLQQFKESGAGQVRHAPGAAQGVTVAPVHQIKGRHFAQVFMPKMAQGNFPISYPLRSGLSEEELHTFFARHSRGRLPWFQSPEQYVRQEEAIFRYALSRAAGTVCLSAAKYYDQPLVESPFFNLPPAGTMTPEACAATLARPGSCEELNRCLARAAETVQQQALKAVHNSVPRAACFDVDYIRQAAIAGRPDQGVVLPADYTFAITALSTLAKCPRRFFYEELLELEEPGRFAAHRGMFIHRVLQLFLEQYPRLAKVSPAQAQQGLADVIAREFSRDRRSFPLSMQAEWTQAEALEQVNTMVAVMREQPDEETLAMEREVAPFVVTWQGRSVRVTGRVDQVGRCGNKLVITDFKTGKHTLAEAAIVKELEKGELSDLQLPLYYLAYRHKEFSSGVNQDHDPRCRILYVFPRRDGKKIMPVEFVAYPSLAPWAELIIQQTVTLGTAALVPLPGGGSQFIIRPDHLQCGYCPAYGVLCEGRTEEE
jgi:superfamily I DNA/RNA helicase/RecB family exonuclease